MRVNHTVKMTLAARARRKLDESGAPIIGRRYWLRTDLDEQRPITLPTIPVSKFTDDFKKRYPEM